MRKFALVAFVFLLPWNSHAQELYKRHLWEFNVSVRTIGHNVSWLAYPFILKRNVGQSNKLGAWRIAVSPFARFNKARYGVDTFSTHKHKDFTFTPTTQIGFEWQKRVSKSMVYYGVDVGWFERIEKTKFTADLRGNNYSDVKVARSRKQIDTIWLSGFAGVRRYITHRYSVSIESQLQFKYNVTSIAYRNDGVRLARDTQRTMSIDPLSYYFVTLSYNF